MLLNFTPYRQFIEWINPIAVIAGTEAKFDLGARAEYDMYFGEFTFTNNQAFLEFTYDVAMWFDAMMAKTTNFAGLIPSAADFALSTPVDWDSNFLLFTPATTVDPSGNWYGTQPIWKKSINGVL